jgi:hypothetical protein
MIQVFELDPFGESAAKADLNVWERFMELLFKVFWY